MFLKKLQDDLDYSNDFSLLNAIAFMIVVVVRSLVFLSIPFFLICLTVLFPYIGLPLTFVVATVIVLIAKKRTKNRNS